MLVHKLLIFLFPVMLSAQTASTAKMVIDHQNVEIIGTKYVDAKLIYDFKPMTINRCTKKELISKAEAIRQTADKLTVEWMDKKTGKMSAVYLGKMPTVTTVTATAAQAEPIGK